MKSILHTLILALCFASTSLGAEYYVGQTNTGDGSGSSAQNLCLGLLDPSCAPQAGDTVYLCGAFTNQIAPRAVDGTSQLPITYDWSCPGGTPATLTLNGTQPYGFIVQQRLNLVLKDINVTGPTSNTGSYGAQVVIVNSQFVKIVSPTTSWNTESGSSPGSIRGHGLFLAGGSRYISVFKASSYENYGAGIRIQNANTIQTGDIVIDSCLAYMNRKAGVSIDGTVTNPKLIQGVVVSRCITFKNGDGIYSHMADGVVIANNVSHHNSRLLFPSIGESYGIASEMSTNITITENTVYDNESDGIEVWGSAVISANGCRIIRNVVYNHRHYTANNTSGNNGIEQRTGYGSGCIIANNESFNNVRNYKIGNDSTNTSVFIHNISRGGDVGLYFDKSNEPGNQGVQGWKIIQNIFESPALFWIFSLTNTNSNVFGLNIFRGEHQAQYNGVTYTQDIIKLDTTAMTDYGG